MKAGSQELFISWDAAGNPWSLRTGGQTYYYVTNLQGDVTAILNGSGDPMVTYTYDAWGNILEIGGEDANTLGRMNPLRYRGYVYDQETGLYYLQSRYYDPEMGRFISADPAYIATGQGLVGNNMFAYCNNNPVMFVDPMGAEPAWTQLGFTYDGTVGDFRRLEQGLPPSAYEVWLESQQTIKVDIVTFEHEGLQLVVTEVTTLRADVAQGEYVSRLEENIEPNNWDLPWLIVSTYVGVKITNPYVGGAIFVFELLTTLGGKAQNANMRNFKSAVSGGQSVLIVKWEVRGDPNAQRSTTSYYSWDEKTLPF